MLVCHSEWLPHLYFFSLKFSQLPAPRQRFRRYQSSNIPVIFVTRFICSEVVVLNIGEHIPEKSLSNAIEAIALKCFHK